MKNFFKLTAITLCSISLFAATPHGTVHTFSALMHPTKNAQHTFDTLIQENNIVVFKCTMKTCGPCKRIAPHVAKLAQKYKEDGVLFVDLDVKAYRSVVQKFNIKSVPSFIIYSLGQHIKTIRGSKKVPDVDHLINQQLKRITR